MNKHYFALINALGYPVAICILAVSYWYLGNSKIPIGSLFYNLFLLYGSTMLCNTALIIFWGIIFLLWLVCWSVTFYKSGFKMFLMSNVMSLFLFIGPPALLATNILSYCGP